MQRGGVGVPARPLTVPGAPLQCLAFDAVLCTHHRPSTRLVEHGGLFLRVVDALGGAHPDGLPPEFPPPLVEWAEGGAGSGASATDAAPEPRDGKLQLLELPISHTLQAEAAVWEHIKASLDSYTRRVSATAGGGAEADGAACALLQRSSVLLGRYEVALLTATTD